MERLLDSVTHLSVALRELAEDFARLLELFDNLTAAQEATRDGLADLDRRLSVLASPDDVADRRDGPG